MAAIVGQSIARFVRLWLLDALTAMLLGMIAYRVGLLTGAWSAKRLVALTIGCLAIGLPLRFASARAIVDSDFSALGFLGTRKLYQVDRIALALAWIGLVLLLMRAPLLQAVRAGLAVVGRVALSNYLLQSALAAGFFLSLGY